MKISILLHEDGKQIMLEPENEHEKMALKMIAPGDKIEAASKWATFDNEEKTYGYHVGLNQAGYYRAWPKDEALVFIVKNKGESTSQEK